MPGSAMNRPKTNTYPKDYDVGGKMFVVGSISPKPWHSVLAAQVDNIIL